MLVNPPVWSSCKTPSMAEARGLANGSRHNCKTTVAAFPKMVAAAISKWRPPQSQNGGRRESKMTAALKQNGGRDEKQREKAVVPETSRQTGLAQDELPDLHPSHYSNIRVCTGAVQGLRSRLLGENKSDGGSRRTGDPAAQRQHWQLMWPKRVRPEGTEAEGCSWNRNKRRGTVWGPRHVMHASAAGQILLLSHAKGKIKVNKIKA